MKVALSSSLNNLTRKDAFGNSVISDGPSLQEQLKSHSGDENPTYAKNLPNISERSNEEPEELPKQTLWQIRHSSSQKEG